MGKNIADYIAKRRVESLLRQLKPHASRFEGKIVFQNKRYIDFSSNDYLGLSSHPKLKAAACKATEEFGTSSSASRLLSGDSDLFHRLEDEVANFKHKEAALVFNSGYQANLGIISALYDKNDAVFADRFVHASIIDGIALSGAKIFRFQHNDCSHLKDLLDKQRNSFDDALIVTESVFSMDADRAPLKELAVLKESYNCKILVDEAHATGIFGKNGSGVVEDEGLSQEIDFIMGTFSKALGSFGAYLASSREAVDYMVNASRSFIYSTALPAAVVAANLAALEVVRDEPQRRRKLLSMASFLRQKLQANGLQIRGESQILPVILGDAAKAVEKAEYLRSKGYWVTAVRPPTVAAAESRLRVSLSFHHSQDMLENFSNELLKFRI